MNATRALYLSTLAMGFALFCVSGLACTDASPSAGGALAIDDDDIGGVVTGADGPEAGVWVIAETTELPTKFVKTVVTDDPVFVVCAIPEFLPDGL